MKDGIAERFAPTPNAGFVGRLALSQQQRLLDAFQEFCQSSGTVLNVRASSPVPTHEAACGFSELADRPSFSHVAMHRVPLANLRDGSMAKTGGRFSLPFADGEFDWVCSNNLIEYAGDAEHRFNLVREMARVAKKGAFIATPNRAHPINFSGVKRSQMLLAQDLYRFASLLPGRPEYDVGHKRVFGIKAHLFLMISKKTPTQ